jgi:hypothetical protein
VTKEHFQTLYDKAPFDHFVYDSKRLGKVRQFAPEDLLPEEVECIIKQHEKYGSGQSSSSICSSGRWTTASKIFALSSSVVTLSARSARTPEERRGRA